MHGLELAGIQRISTAAIFVIALRQDPATGGSNVVYCSLIERFATAFGKLITGLVNRRSQCCHLHLFGTLEIFVRLHNNKRTSVLLDRDWATLGVID